MQFIHAREHLNSGDAVRVDSDTQCNVMLTTDTEFARFQRGEGCQHFGGFYQRFPILLRPDRAGFWNITLDVGRGSEATIRYSINVVRGG